LQFNAGARTTSRFASLAAAVLVVGAAAAGATGCGGHRPRPAALRVERADLVQLAHTLQRLQRPTATEVVAARAAWSSIAGGLPDGVAPALRVKVTAAERRAATLALPAEVTTEGSITGPAAELAGMLKAYVRLTQRGWQYLAAALAAGSGTSSAHSAAHARQSAPGVTGAVAPAPGGRGSSATARFLHANAPLYVYCVYDGHYDLSLIGKVVQSAYFKLGGPPAFGASLTQSQVEALARAYSIPATRLEPHPAPSVAV
jgi:hypothetical protein